MTCLFLLQEEYMDDSVLKQVAGVMEQNPHSGQSLLLFALCKTLDMPKGGHMYMLKKLQDMTPETRQLAYRLMEYMAEGKIDNNPEWQESIKKMEAIIQG